MSCSILKEIRPSAPVEPLKPHFTPLKPQDKPERKESRTSCQIKKASNNPEGVIMMPYNCGRCQKEFETVFKMVFYLGDPPLELNLCQKCIDEVNNYYNTYNIYVRRKVIGKLPAVHPQY